MRVCVGELELFQRDWSRGLRVGVVLVWSYKGRRRACVFRRALRLLTLHTRS